MNIDMKSTIDQLKVLENQLSGLPISKAGIENSYLCICGMEEIAKEILRFVENHKTAYHNRAI